ncbi:MAG: hypothetical protein ACK4M6_06635 [Hyphomonas sp.]
MKRSARVPILLCLIAALAGCAADFAQGCRSTADYPACMGEFIGLAEALQFGVVSEVKKGRLEWEPWDALICEATVLDRRDA